MRSCSPVRCSGHGRPGLLLRLLPPPADCAPLLPLLPCPAGHEEGLREDAARFSLLDELPFDFVRRRLSVVLQARAGEWELEQADGCMAGRGAQLVSLPPPLPATTLCPSRLGRRRAAAGVQGGGRGDGASLCSGGGGRWGAAAAGRLVRPGKREPSALQLQHACRVQPLTAHSPLKLFLQPQNSVAGHGGAAQLRGAARAGRGSAGAAHC